MDEKNHTKYILFDTDGVLVNSEMFSTQYQKKYKISNDKMLPFFKGEFQKCLIGQADLKETITPYLKSWKWNGTTDDLLNFWFTSEHQIDEQIIKLIKKLKQKGITCCLATNQEKYRTQYMKTVMGFDGLFDYIFSSSEIGYKKTDPRFYQIIFEKIKQKYNINKQQILLVDNEQANIAEAIKFGYRGYLYTDFKKFKNSLKTIL